MLVNSHAQVEERDFSRMTSHFRAQTHPLGFIYHVTKKNDRLWGQEWVTS